MIELTELNYSERVHCWHPSCKAAAKVSVRGMGCDGSPYCLKHLVAELITNFYREKRSSIWSQLRKHAYIFD